MLLAQHNSLVIPGWIVFGVLILCIAGYVLAIVIYVFVIRHSRTLAKFGLALSVVPLVLGLISFATSEAREYLIYGRFHPMWKGRQLPTEDVGKIIVAHLLWSAPLIICSLVRLSKRDT